MQELRKNINADYYCEKAKQSGLIRVFNVDEYLMVEYSQNTDAVRWQRLAAAPQKAGIERWLTQHFPVSSSKAAALSSRL
jgi:hypothetical protein